MIMKFLLSKMGMAAAGLAAVFLAWQVGSMVGYREGTADAKLKQFEANVAAEATIKERIKNALDEIGADTSDVAIDSVLRDLAGQ